MKHQTIFALLILAICTQTVFSLKCLECGYEWNRIVDDDDDSIMDCSYGNTKCATDPSVSERAIKETTCGTGQVCATFNIVGSGKEGTRFTEAVAVGRACVDKPQDFTDSCFTTDHLPDLPNWPPGGFPNVDVDPASEICQCESDNCNSKKYKSAAVQLHMSALWIVTVILAYVGY